MHEMGIIVHVAKQLRKIALDNNVKKIGSVTLEIGEVSGIVDSFLIDYWDYYCKKDDLLAGSKLIIEPLEAVTFCEDCEKTYSTVKYGKTCPYCGSPHTYLLKGTECSIKEIEAC